MFDISYTTLAIITTASLTALYFYLTKNFNYWSSRGVKGPKPVVLFGNVWELIIKRFQLIEEDRLAKYGSIYGIYMGKDPMLVVADPELIKNIMVKDFHIFVNRRDLGPIDEVMDHAMTVVKDDEWKRQRSIVSPSFTTGKLRKMMTLVDHCAQSVDRVLDKVATDGNEIEMKGLMGNYTMDVIASCAFATKTDTHNDPNNPFVVNAKSLFSGSLWRGVLFLLANRMMRFFKISIIDPSVYKFFLNAIKEIIKQRKEDQSGHKHYDFLQLMIDAQKKVDNNVTAVDDDNNSSSSADDKLMDAEAHHGLEDNSRLLKNRDKLEIKEIDILATSFVFFLAGYETTATLLAHLIYSLAINPESQQKLVDEIRGNCDASGHIDYETIIRLPYLDACISETLRMYSPAPQTGRVASQDYKLGDTGITVEKGVHIIIPIHALHYNPDYYPEPKQFRPERFLPENRDKIIPYTYLPFGAGPRNCVGMRFALMEAKTVVVRTLIKYEFVRTANTKVPLKYVQKSTFPIPTDITIGVQYRQTV
ncbi:cytochrome P450 3A8-like [Oppia nitens]|uniref:cytochrome P450 3A8-like n=1 Tax=Oppia nitens TaxID=1686743 RepID=UPI0023DA0D20|nr:cytochrome P450 3A8-like [Oppia nitens]